MRKLSVSTLVSLDGVIQDPDGFGETVSREHVGARLDDEIRIDARLGGDACVLGNGS